MIPLKDHYSVVYFVTASVKRMAEIFDLQYYKKAQVYLRTLVMALLL